GIAFAGKAGMSKESEMSPEAKKEVIREFNLKKGVLVATFSGIMSACFSYGLKAGDPIKEIALRHGTTTLWQGLPVLVPVLLGGFTTNFIWCVILNVRNRSGHEYLHGGSKDLRVPLGLNYFFSAVAGSNRHFPFFFYTMGGTQKGGDNIFNLPVHTANIIIFISAFGITLHYCRHRIR